MAENLVTYCVVHQPRRIKLPAQVIPRGTKPGDMAGYLLDDVMNKRYFDKVAKLVLLPGLPDVPGHARPGLQARPRVLGELPLAVAAAGTGADQRFRKLVAHPNCELVGVEPYHSFAFALDIKLFQKEMSAARITRKSSSAKRST